MDVTTQAWASQLYTGDPLPVECDQFICDNFVECYTGAQLCDGVQDCGDATDEKADKCKSAGLGKGGTAGVVFGALIISVIVLSVCVCYFRHRSRLRKKRLMMAEDSVHRTRQAYRNEVRRREIAEAEAAENTNQIAFQTFGDPPSYEDVLNSPALYPQSTSMDSLDRIQRTETQTTQQSSANHTASEGAPTTPEPRVGSNEHAPTTPERGGGTSELDQIPLAPNRTADVHVVNETQSRDVVSERNNSASANRLSADQAGVSTDNARHAEREQSVSNTVNSESHSPGENADNCPLETSRTNQLAEAAPLLSSSREMVFTLPRSPAGENV